jgi:Uma2 family endonuclease
MAQWSSPYLEQAMPVSEQTYRQLAWEDPDGHWELHHGCLRKKPDMTLDHNRIARDLYFTLRLQLDRTQFDVSVNMGQVRLSPETYYIPDVYVIPVELQEQLKGKRVLEAYDTPLPLVVEVWSPSTGDLDVETKLRDYQRGGDLEIWRIHPYEHTLTTWRRQPDGSYSETHHSGGTIQPMAVPNVTIDFDALFQ